jgi:hypothetical protein
MHLLLEKLKIVPAAWPEKKTPKKDMMNWGKVIFP